MKKTLKGITFGIAAIMASFLPCISTHAESKTATVTASIAESLSLTLSAGSMDFNLETNDLYTDFINVIGRTNSANGYTISFNANNDYNDLKHSNALIEDKIASIEGPRTESEFPNKSWGYSVDESNYTFKKIPLNPKNIFATSEQGETTHKFTTGVKGSADLVAGDYENELLFTIIANPLVNNTDDDDDDAPLVYDEKAKAILGTNGNLNFVYDDNTYAIGDTYNDNTGETDIADIFRVPLNSHNWNTKPDWANNPDIVSVNFDESFRNFYPTKTAYWFFEDQHMTTVTNAQNFNASTVTNMSGMFKYVGENAESDINIDLTSWDVSNVKKMTEMFEYIGYNTTKNIDVNLQGWDTENLVDLSYFMDNSARNAESITVNMNDWDVRKVQTMYNALYYIGSSAKNIDISLNNWNAEKLTNMSNMLQSAGYNQYTYADSTLNISMKNFRAPILESIGQAFDYVGYRCSGNVGGTANIDFSNMSLPNITSAYRMFNQIGMYNQNINLNVSGLKIPKATNLSEMFYNSMYRTDNVKIDVSNWQMDSAENMSKMFSYVGYGSGYKTGTENPDLYSWEIKGLETFDMDKVTNVSGMFNSAAEYNFAREISLDLSNWNTEKIEDASAMFTYFAQLSTSNIDIKLNNWNTEKITDISEMFSSAMQYAESVDIDLSGWNTENITNMDSAFAYAGEHAGSLSVNGLNDWDVSNASRVNIFQSTGKDCGFVAPF